jgi:acetyl esterase/lipase
VPSPEHEQFVAALPAGGSVLTPTTLPTDEALQEMRAFEATAGFTVPEGTTVADSRYGGVDCLRLDAAGRGRTAIYFHGGGYVYTRIDYVEHPDVIHMWMVRAPDLPESCQAFDAAAEFLSHLPA